MQRGAGGCRRAATEQRLRAQTCDPILARGRRLILLTTCGSLDLCCPKNTLYVRLD